MDRTTLLNTGAVAGSALILADSSWFMLIVYAILFALLYFKYGKSEKGAAVQAQSTAEKSGTPVKEEDARQMQQLEIQAQTDSTKLVDEGRRAQESLKAFVERELPAELAEKALPAEPEPETEPEPEPEPVEEVVEAYQNIVSNANPVIDQQEQARSRSHSASSSSSSSSSEAADAAADEQLNVR